MKKYLLIASLVGMCAAAWATGESEAATIRAMHDAFDSYGADLLAGDAEAWGMLHTEDVVKMPPDVSATTTRADMVARLSKTLQALTFTAFDVTIEETEVDGGLALSWGTYAWSARLSSGATISYDGKFLTVFRKQPDGAWLIAYDCFNSNVPPAAGQ